MAVPPALVMLDASELSARIHRREVSCREVMATYLDHIERLNPAVNAIVSLRPREALLAEAGEADAALARGEDRGWMHGLPHAVKDLAETRGLRTTRGSPLFADDVPAADAVFVERLRAAGAILVGKTNTPEFGLGSQTYNAVFGTTGNAYDPSRTAGGSSGGAAAALAMRLVPVADGSDFAGSLRNPAGWNNVFGFRPSAGRVPHGPLPELFMQNMGYDGPMARRVGDLALLLSVMAGYDDRTPLSLDGDGRQFAAPLGRDMRGVRIGWLGDLGGIPMETGMLDLCLGGLRRLEAAGCTIEEARLGIGRDVIWDSFVALRQGFMAGSLRGLYADPAARARLKPEAVWEIEGGLRRSAADLFEASARRSAVYRAFRDALRHHDFLALPSAQVFPFDAALHWPAEVAGVAMDSYHRWMEVVAGPSLAGLPVVAVPAGFGPAGLPSGIQLVGRARQDLAVLQLAHAYEQVAGDVLSRLPPLLAG
ncbi:amidase [Roseomonas sp. NAR14]|uniref:Amidase n=1 Tax=Roseomonas acroporae TaxID=2937791 RepID=A0A9X2BVP8_9PROT|nr:amidase [Roseomonas acroporae]MCK8785291.1 amidase [Roseomonas acroporae]